MVDILTDTRLWAVDKVILGYLAVASALTIALYPRVPGALTLIVLHVVAVAVLMHAIRRPARWTGTFRRWYALPYVGACYKEASILIPALGRPTADQWLANIDFHVWGANPTVWIERFYWPPLTEYLQVVYALFIPAVLLIPFLLWRRQHRDFQYYLFLIAFGFLVSYIGYFLVPARGPRFLLADFQRAPLQGLWLFRPLQVLLDRLESAHYDCFPSGHVQMTVLAWWGSRLVSRPLFGAYSVYTACIIVATVYLRYHYTVDLLAGILVAAALIAVSPWIFRKLSFVPSL
jgi:membrane-associated phospholipid phosphatase